jgi:hypothetical protein
MDTRPASSSATSRPSRLSVLSVFFRSRSTDGGTTSSSVRPPRMTPSSTSQGQDQGQSSSSLSSAPYQPTRRPRPGYMGNRFSPTNDNDSSSEDDDEVDPNTIATWRPMTHGTAMTRSWGGSIAPSAPAGMIAVPVVDHYGSTQWTFEPSGQSDHTSGGGTTSHGRVPTHSQGNDEVRYPTLSLGRPLMIQGEDSDPPPPYSP